MNTEADISKILFRSSARLPIWSEISGFDIEKPEPFYATQIWDMIREKNTSRTPGLSPSRVRSELIRLDHMDMVRRLPHRPEQRPVWYVRTNPEAWSIFDKVLQAGGIEPPSDEILDRSRRVKVSFGNWPESVHERLGQLVDMANEAGTRTGLGELAAAIVASATADGERLRELVFRYRRGEMEEVHLGDEQ